MQISEMFQGAAGTVFASTIILIILCMMLFMSFRLYISRGRKAYFLLTLSLIIMIIHYSMTVILQKLQAADAVMIYIDQVIKMIGLILFHMSIFQLFNKTTKKAWLIFYGWILLIAPLSLLYFVVPHLMKGEPALILLIQTLVLDLYVYILLFYAFFIVSSYIGQHVKYKIAVGIYFLSHTLYILHTYVNSVPNQWSLLGSNFLPILYYLIFFSIVFERIVELLQAIYQSSITDSLTGLYNRRYFERVLNQCLRESMQVGLIFADIDNFKKLNDTKGHDAGDVVLRQVAKIFKEESAGIGTAGRYGGEEMMILITEQSKNTRHVAEKIRTRVETDTSVTISVGYSINSKHIHGEKLIQQADEAMYHAKKNGKNQVVKYPPRLKD